jgi:hypothetical protein
MRLFFCYILILRIQSFINQFSGYQQLTEDEIKELRKLKTICAEVGRKAEKPTALGILENALLKIEKQEVAGRRSAVAAPMRAVAAARLRSACRMSGRRRSRSEGSPAGTSGGTVGIGAVPGQISKLLADSDLKDLGIHTEMAPQGTHLLVEKGVVRVARDIKHAHLAVKRGQMVSQLRPAHLRHHHNRSAAIGWRPCVVPRPAGHLRRQEQYAIGTYYV